MKYYFTLFFGAAVLLAIAMDAHLTCENSEAAATRRAIIHAEAMVNMAIEDARAKIEVAKIEAQMQLDLLKAAREPVPGRDEAPALAVPPRFTL